MKIKLPVMCLLLAISLLSGCSETPAKSSSSKEAKASSYYTQLGVGYLQRGRLDLASLNLEKALADDPGSADVNHYYALLQENLGNDAKASEHFQTALRKDGKNPELLNNYGSFLCKTGNIQGAEQAFMTAVNDPLYRTPEFAYTNAGICVLKRGDTQAAENDFRQALQKNPAYGDALYQMAKLSHEKGDDPKAQAFLYRYNESAPDTADSLLLCYQVQSALNEREKAEACAVNLRGRFPDSAAASQIN
jgi:type IV pilus assembly protein PilF